MSAHTPPILSLSRSFAAPRDLVWKCYSQIEHLKEWWGPKGLEWLGGTLDFRPGGIFHYGMRMPNGQEMWGKFIYREIIAPEKLSFIVTFSDRDGDTTRHPMAADWPLQVLNSMIFRDVDGHTVVEMLASPFDASETERKAFEANIQNVKGGMGGTFSQLDTYLAQIQNEK